MQSMDMTIKLVKVEHKISRLVSGRLILMLQAVSIDPLESKRSHFP